ITYHRVLFLQSAQSGAVHLFPVSFFDMEGLEGRVVNDSPADCQSAPRSARRRASPVIRTKTARILKSLLFLCFMLICLIFNDITLISTCT
ncbi:MAG TPA: hypothetical protein PKV51_08580, partial [Bacillota bacterium]|nr:hypothetical protein [Bacillota bacterium]